MNLPEANKGCLLVQFPPSLKVGAQTQLKELLQLLEGYNWRVVVEFRDPSWYSDGIFELFEDHRAAMVIQDMPRSAAPIRR